jgi:predicted SAM-dependent methyltransferase
VLSRLPLTRSTIDLLLWEARAASLRLSSALLPTERRRLRQIREERDCLLNVACGPQVLPGFFNLDLRPATPQILRWDCRTTLPVSDGAAAGIRAEHFLEHLDPRDEAPLFLRACHRALASGGVLRLIVPDAERYLMAYCAGGLSGYQALGVPIPFPADLPTRLDVINHVFHQWDEHRWAYDFETLEHRLRQAGFSRIERSAYRESSLPVLAQDREAHAPYSLYVDATKC